MHNPISEVNIVPSLEVKELLVKLMFYYENIYLILTLKTLHPEDTLFRKYRNLKAVKHKFPCLLQFSVGKIHL